MDAVASGGEREVTGHESSTLCRNPYVEEVAELEPRHMDIAAHDDVGHSAAAALRGAVLTPLALHGHAAEHAPLGGADGVGADGGAGGGAVQVGEDGGDACLDVVDGGVLFEGGWVGINGVDGVSDLVRQSSRQCSLPQTHTHTHSLLPLHTQLALTLIVHGVHVGKVLIELQTGVVHLGGDKGGQVEGRDAVL